MCFLVMEILGLSYIFPILCHEPERLSWKTVSKYSVLEGGEGAAGVLLWPARVAGWLAYLGSEGWRGPLVPALTAGEAGGRSCVSRTHFRQVAAGPPNKDDNQQKLYCENWSIG